MQESRVPSRGKDWPIAAERSLLSASSTRPFWRRALISALVSQQCQLYVPGAFQELKIASHDRSFYGGARPLVLVRRCSWIAVSSGTHFFSVRHEQGTSAPLYWIFTRPNTSSSCQIRGQSDM